MGKWKTPHPSSKWNARSLYVSSDGKEQLVKDTKTHQVKKVKGEYPAREGMGEVFQNYLTPDLGLGEKRGGRVLVN